MPTVLADIATDGSLGPAVDFPGPNYAIPADIGVQHGGNLFHSFIRFNIGTGENALFSGPASISHVISRVTGGQVSWIDGSLDCDIAGADFYFVNPAGIVFGPNAALNVGASFFVSTANYIRLSDAGSFNASDPGNSSLTSAPPAAFGFMAGTPGNISVSLSQESVVVSRGASQAAVFIRGERFVIHDSTVGTVNNGSAAIGEVDIDLTGSLEISGTGAIASLAYGDGKGGDIRVSANNLSLSEGASLFTYTAEAGNAGNIRINTDESLSIAGKNEQENASRLMSLSDGSGGTGDIDITAGVLSLESEGRIINHHNNDGYRGTTSITAEAIAMDSNSIMMCGNLVLEAGTLEISDGAYIWGRPSLYNPNEPPLLRITASESLFITGQGQSEVPWRNKTHPLYTGIHTDTFVFPEGSGGSIELSSPLIVVSESGQISSRTYTDDPAGNTVIDTDKLILREGGQIAADSFGSSSYDGPAGKVTINASELVEISGSKGELCSGFFSNTRSNGNAGQIEVITPLLTLSDTGRINVKTGYFGRGDAGRIFLKTDMLQILPGGGISALSWGYGDEGRIEIVAKDGILIRDGFIESNGDWDGAAGDIILETASLNLIGGIITASTEESGSRKGGNIIITASNMTLESNSEIRAFSRGWGDVAGRLGNGGNIDIHRPIFVILENAEIIANAFEGAGGNIQIDTQQLIQDPNSRIDASSQKGIDGRIDISSPDTDISGSITVLPDTFLDATAFMKNLCDAKTMGNTSSLVSTGFNGARNAPEDPLISDYYGSNHYR